MGWDQGIALVIGLLGGGGVVKLISHFFPGRVAEGNLEVKQGDLQLQHINALQKEVGLLWEALHYCEKQHKECIETALNHEREMAAIKAHVGMASSKPKTEQSE